MKISELRSILGLTNDELAAEIGCTVRSVYLWQQKGKTIDGKGILKPYRIAMQKLMDRKVKA